MQTNNALFEEILSRGGLTDKVVCVMSPTNGAYHYVFTMRGRIFRLDVEALNEWVMELTEVEVKW